MLDFEYGVNTGNRFLQFVDHDEEPEAFIAAQTKPEPVQKKSTTKDAKQTTKKSTSKPATTTTTTTASTAKTNKENLTSKSAGTDQRKPQSASSTAVFSDNNQQTRGDSARGARGGPRRGNAGSFEGAGRGRSQRFNKFEGQQTSLSTNEPSSFDQSGEGWSTEAGARGNRGRGGPRRGNFEGGRGTGGRGRGRGGRGGASTGRNFEEGSQDIVASADNDTSFDNNRGQSSRDYDPDVSPQERGFEIDGTRRTSNRGNYRGRPYQGNRGRDGETGQEDYRANRRMHDRQPRNFVSTVKPVEKKDGEGAHNWGNLTENPEDHLVAEEPTEATGTVGTDSKNWAQVVDEAEKQMTLDEYKKQLEEKKRSKQEKLPQFNTRTAGEGEDPKVWQKPVQVYRKKNNADGSDDDDDEDREEGSGDEENESEEEYEEEQTSGKKKLISIPLYFKPIEMGRGSSRGGPRRGSGRYRDRPPRDDNAALTSPNQDQSGPAGPHSADDSQGSYRGGPRGGRGEYRRSGGNTARSSRQGRPQTDPNAPSLDNPDDFPTLPKQVFFFYLLGLAVIIVVVKADGLNDDSISQQTDDQLDMEE